MTVSAPDAAKPPVRLPQRSLFIALLFAAVFVALRLTIQPINSLDYETHIDGLRLFWAGDSPYRIESYFLPPWAAFVIAPLVNQPLETWLALSLALFITALLDLGRPAALLLLLHPVTITLVASSNPEWIFVGSGLWLLYRTPRGWGRGLAWLLLACKPQTTFLLLLFEGFSALRQRDWRAALLAAAVALTTWAFYPDYLTKLFGAMRAEWGSSVMFHYGAVGALAATACVLALRWRKLRDWRTLGILLSAIWTPYQLQYAYMSVLFTLRRARWWRVLAYVGAGIALVSVFWQDYHTAEHIATLGFVLLAALLAPADRPPSSPAVTNVTEKP